MLMREQGKDRRMFLQVISRSLAIGPIAHYTRACYATINKRKTWLDSLLLSEEAKAELRFWQECLPLFNGQPIWFESSATRVAYSDASSSGYGGYVVEIGPSISHGHWTLHEANMSSTWRELKAVFLVLQSLAQKLQGHTVKWFTDNQNVVRIVQVGSMKPHLQEGAMPCHAMPCLYSRYAYSTVLNYRWNGYLEPRTNLQIMLVA